MTEKKNDKGAGKPLPIKLITSIIVGFFVVLVLGFMIIPAYFDQSPFGKLFHNEPAPWAISPEDQQKFKLTDSELKGKNHFREYCASCHGPEGKGNGPSSVTLRKRLPNFMGTSENYINGLNPSGLLKTLNEGIANSEMPSYPYLPEDAKIQIIDFLMYLQKNKNYQM